MIECGPVATEPKVGGIPKIVLATPRYGDDVIAASFTAYQNAEANDLFPPEDSIQIVHRVSHRSSLLPNAFNSCLAESLNKRNDGVATHMALIHSDVAAEAGWLNRLASVMRKRGDAAVSAVVCLKETNRQKTTTAIGARGNIYEVRRMLTTADRLRMPETFSTADVASEPDDVLLINTGMMLIDLRVPFFDDFAFRFRDDILIHPVTGKRQAYVCPEDWLASREMDAAGVPFSATWAVKTFHYGPSIWNSHEIPATNGGKPC